MRNVGDGRWHLTGWGMLEVALASDRMGCGECWRWHLTGWGVGNVGGGTGI